MTDVAESSKPRANEGEIVEQVDRLMGVVTPSFADDLKFELSLRTTTRKRPRGGGGGGTIVLCEVCVTTLTPHGIRTQVCRPIPCPKEAPTAPAEVTI
jgi:hypothetical protein